MDPLSRTIVAWDAGRCQEHRPDLSLVTVPGMVRAPILTEAVVTDRHGALIANLH